MRVCGKSVNQGGFTLLEVLVALFILAMAGAAILRLVQQYIDFGQRARAHQEDVTALLNRAAEVAITDRRLLRTNLNGDHVEVYLPGETEVAATVRNYPFEGVSVPISLGYSPRQTYAFESRFERKLVLIGDGLPPPR